MQTAVRQYLGPIRLILDFLNEPLPGISDIIGDVNLLDAAEVATALAYLGDAASLEDIAAVGAARQIAGFLDALFDQVNGYPDAKDLKGVRQSEGGFTVIVDPVGNLLNVDPTVGAEPADPGAAGV